MLVPLSGSTVRLPHSAKQSRCDSPAAAKATALDSSTLAYTAPMALETENQSLLHQLEALIQESPLPASIVAIYFGLFESAGDEGSFPQLYVIGTTEYDPDDEDWACIDDGAWAPEGRYLEVGRLRAMDPENFEGIHEYCRDLLLSVESQLTRLFGKPQGRPVALGWDDGDIETLFTARAS